MHRGLDEASRLAAAKVEWEAARESARPPKPPFRPGGGAAASADLEAEKREREERTRTKEAEPSMSLP